MEKAERRPNKPRRPNISGDITSVSEPHISDLDTDGLTTNMGGHQEPLLSLEEEVELFAILRAGEAAQTQIRAFEDIDQAPEELLHAAEQGHRAATRIVLSNQGLVATIALQNRYLHVPYEDLIQLGNLGLLRAIQLYRPEFGNKFSTYAHAWIYQAVTRLGRDAERLIRIPEHFNQILRKIDTARNELQLQLNREPTIDEIAGAMGKTPDWVNEMLQHTKGIISLDVPIGESGTTLYDLSAFTDPTLSVEDQCLASIETEENNTQIACLLDSLPPRAAEIIRLRYGIGHDRSYTLTEVGEKFGLTRERIRQIEQTALAKLKTTTYKK